MNLIGEHTDYNGGHVFPCALTMGTYFIARKRADRILRFYSENFADLGVIEGSLDNLSWTKEAGWTNYPMGVIWAFGEKGYEISNGFDILLYGNIPNGSGLSSSASVEVGMGVLLCDVCGFNIDMIDIALIGQYSENNFNNVNCGIMDQFVIACSNKKRGLGDSKYNERRAECEEALEELKKVVYINDIGELTEEQFEEYKNVIASPIRQKRAKHAVYENQRTIKAVKALNDGNLIEFGKLMIASHESLRDDYEVTGIELDTLVDAALKQPGVIGSRMTGAGFGGCTVSIVKNDCIDMFIKNVGEEYLREIGYAADFYVVEVGEGAGRI